MYPQSELENYKLQVELLQEKLKRSEERRQQLEDKFENIMKRRNEHERLMRAKSRFKYQQFLQEQTERNERNKSLIRALERIDQQAAALAARSERLKILKVQYELYFNQMLQFRGISSPPLNYNIYNHPQTMPIASHFNYSADSNSGNPRAVFLVPEDGNGNFTSMPEFDSYRHADTTIPEDTIVSASDYAPHRRHQQEVNLKPNIKDVIATKTGISSPDPHNQSPLFADTRISIDSSRYKGEDPKAIDYRYDGGSGVIARAKPAISVSDRPQSSEEDELVENSNETQGPGKSYGGNDNLKRESNLSSQGSQPPVSSEGSVVPELQSQPFTLDKLPPINRDEALGKLLAKLYDDAIKKDSVEGEKSSEKSQPRCAIEGKNMSVIKGKIMDAMESQLTLAHIAEKVAGDNMSSCNNGTNALNHSGRVDKLGTDYFPSIKKKEKLSIETIENAIYGERITPAPTLSEGKLSFEKLGQALSENLQIDSNERAAEMNPQEEKSNEGVENIASYQGVLDAKQSYQNVDDSCGLQTTKEETQESHRDSASYSESQPQYNFQSEAYNPEQYPEPPNNYPEQPQYDTNLQEQPYQDYDYSQTLDQQQSYAPQQEQVYESQEEQNYANPEDLSYPEYTEQNYAPVQYENYDQSFLNNYPETEYEMPLQPQDINTQQQEPPLDNNGYEYTQDGVNTGPYNPDNQYYPDPQYEQQNYQENPSQEYYEYNESEQVAGSNYDTQPQDYSQIEDSSNQSLPVRDDQSFEAEINSLEASEFSSEPPPPTLEKTKDDINMPDPQNIQESTTMPSANPSESLESAKPTSILATSEKSYESLPVAAKNKKKKRVNFIESESTPSNPSPVAKSESPVASGGSGTSTSK